MSSIVWVLTIIASGMYGMPVPVRMTFQTESACEQVRKTVEVDRQPVKATCEPKKAQPGTTRGDAS
jgi:nucleoside diphosphate kinase